MPKDRSRLEASRRRDADNQQWITPHQLRRDRNWTEMAINRWLGPAQKVARPGGYIELYPLRRVLSVEAQPDFKEWMTKRMDRELYRGVEWD